MDQSYTITGPLWALVTYAVCFLGIAICAGSIIGILVAKRIILKHGNR